MRSRARTYRPGGLPLAWANSLDRFLSWSACSMRDGKPCTSACRTSWDFGTPKTAETWSSSNATGSERSICRRLRDGSGAIADPVPVGGGLRALDAIGFLKEWNGFHSSPLRATCFFFPPCYRTGGRNRLRPSTHPKTASHRPAYRLRAAMSSTGRTAAPPTRCAVGGALPTRHRRRYAAPLTCAPHPPGLHRTSDSSTFDLRVDFRMPVLMARASTQAHPQECTRTRAQVGPNRCRWLSSQTPGRVPLPLLPSLRFLYGASAPSPA